MCCSYTKILLEDPPKKALRESKEESEERPEDTLISESISGNRIIKGNTFLRVLKKIIAMLSLE